MLENLLKETKALIFDFDGVLADSEPYYYQSYNKAFEKRGHTIKEEDYWEYWTSKGEGVAGEAKRCNIDLSEDEIKIMFQERVDNFAQFCRLGVVPLFPGMLEMLCNLEKRGAVVAIASSSLEDDIKMIFDKAGSKSLPCTVVGRGKGLRPKPHPDVFIYAAGTLNVEPSSCLVIEDSHKGIIAAHTAGMKCAILKNRYNRKLEYPDADAIIENHQVMVDATSCWNPQV